MKKSFSIFLLFLLATFYSCANQIINDRIIWKGQQYAAFTSLSHFYGYFYCAFREADSHWDNTGKDCGVIRVIRSKDGIKWNLYRSFKIKGHDLRDPQLCITPDKKLMLTAEDVVYKNKKAVYRNTIVAYKTQKGKFSKINSLYFKPAISWNWLWQPAEVNDGIGGFIYCPFFAFVHSKDGRTFEVGEKINVLPMPTEASVAFFHGSLYTIVRTNGKSVLGKSSNGNKWQWVPIRYEIGCPKLFVYKDKLFCVGRSYQVQSKTTIFEIDVVNHLAKTLCHLTESKDNAYPGVVIYDNKIYVTYYSGDGKKSNIHFSEIKI